MWSSVEYVRLSFFLRKRVQYFASSDLESKALEMHAEYDYKWIGGGNDLN